MLSLGVQVALGLESSSWAHSVTWASPLPPVGLVSPVKGEWVGPNL